jgi:hypothetical protein
MYFIQDLYDRAMMFHQNASIGIAGLEGIPAEALFHCKSIK